MGTCYSLISGRGRTAEQEDEEVGVWGKFKDDRNHKKTSLGSQVERDSSGDSGGGRGAGAAADERLLLQIPGRLFGNGSSDVACLFTQQGKKGTNQDAMLVWENFSSRSDTVFCGVFDGHGPYGHMISKRVRDSLPVLLCSQWESNSKGDQSENGNSTRSTNLEECVEEDWCEPLEVEENEKLPEMYQPLKQSMLKAFKLMDKELKLHPVIDCFCSGTTAVTLIKQGQDLIIGNVGDSRAVLATRDEDNALTVVQLTVDLKPNLPRETARIQQCFGRVFALQDEPEVARVWLPNSDTPGLAMARAFGDFCLKDFGLISVPEIYYHRLTQRDAFVILATDGVWDVLSNKEAVDIVASAPGHATAARALVDSATRAWRLKYPTSKNDDCAVVCLFLENVQAAEEPPSDNYLANDTAAVKIISDMNGHPMSSGVGGISASHVSAVFELSSTFKGSDEIEIVPVLDAEENIPEGCLGQSKRSLAECLSVAEEEEWSALEGFTRVNSLLSLPRFLSSDKRTGSWRKWL